MLILIRQKNSHFSKTTIAIANREREGIRSEVNRHWTRDSGKKENPKPELQLIGISMHKLELAQGGVRNRKFVIIIAVSDVFVFRYAV